MHEEELQERNEKMMGGAFYVFFWLRKMELKVEGENRIQRYVWYYDAFLYFFGSEVLTSVEKKQQQRKDKIFIMYICCCFGYWDNAVI